MGIGRAVVFNEVERGVQFECYSGERVELPVIFIVDPNIPLDIGSLSLGYTLFDITDQLSENQIAAL